MAPVGDVSEGVHTSAVEALSDHRPIVIDLALDAVV
ncbi:MAG: hypothetical protein QOK37_2169 [Thermoanaerobaculia bacterium]|jgi:hypothetical protein|nr:hypothetical protein [Thermoanaerobaculia bacterium]